MKITGLTLYASITDHASDTIRRDSILKLIPRLANYFKNIIIAPYPDLIKDVAERENYFAPLLDATRAVGMTIIPGINLMHAVQDDREVWKFSDRLVAPQYTKDIIASQPRGKINDQGLALWSPSMLLDRRVWTKVFEWSRDLCRTCNSDVIWHDGEYVFWDTKNSAWWKDIIVGGYTVMLHALLAAKMTPLCYHPHPHPSFFAPSNQPMTNYQAMLCMVPPGCEFLQPWLYEYLDRSLSPAAYVHREWQKIGSACAAAGFATSHNASHPAFWYDNSLPKCWTAKEYFSVRDGAPNLFNRSVLYTDYDRLWRLLDEADQIKIA